MGAPRPGEPLAPPSAPGPGQVVVLGRFGAPFGVQGWIKLESYTEPPEQILRYPALRAGAAGGEVAVRDWKRVGRGQLAVQVDGVVSRDAAVGLRGAELWVRRADLPPTARGEFVRLCLEGLALTYRKTLEGLEDVLWRRINRIHVVGGGSQNALLCQWTADACGRRVQAGPVEATALGNVLVQAIGLGLLGSLADAREVVRRSVEVVTYEPKDAARWDEQWPRFANLVRG